MGRVFTGYIGKQAEKASEPKTAGSSSPCHCVSSCFQVPALISPPDELQTVNRNKSFLLQEFLWFVMFIAAIENKVGHFYMVSKHDIFLFSITPKNEL